MGSLAIGAGLALSGTTLSVSVANSITIAGAGNGSVQLLNDSASPGANYFYGTDGAGVKGWQTDSSFTVTSLQGTAGQVLVGGTSGSPQTGALTLTLATALTSINSVTSVALSPLVLATGSSGTAISIASATNIVTFSAGLVGTTATLSSLTAGRVTFAGTAGLLTDASTLTFSAGTLTATAYVGNSLTTPAGTALVLATGTTGTAISIASATNIATFSAGIAGTTITMSSLTSGRVPFASTGGLLVDDADMTFSGGDTLTVTKATIGSITHVANAIGAANSVTSVAGQNLALATGTFGTAITIASASGNVTLASNTSAASTSTGALVINGNIALGGDGTLYMGSMLSLFANGAANGPIINIVNAASNGAGLYGTGSGLGIAVSNTAVGSWTISAFNVLVTTEASAIGTAATVISGGLSVAKSSIVQGGQGWGVTSTATAGATTTLTAASRTVQIFTGGTTQDVQLPAANALGSGVSIVYVVVNKSTAGAVRLLRAGSDTIEGGPSYTVPIGARAIVTSDGSGAWAVI